MRQYKKPNTTTKHRHRAADGHVGNSPTGHDPHVRGGEPGRLKAEPSADNYPTHFGPRIDRVGEDNKRLSNITNERARSNAHPLARRFTKSITNFRGQVKIPRDVIGGRGLVVPSGVKCLDVSEIPED